MSGEPQIPTLAAPSRGYYVDVSTAVTYTWPASLSGMYLYRRPVPNGAEYTRRQRARRRRSR